MVQAKPLRLPLEVLLLILHSTDSKSTLLAWCCLCHALHNEAEQLLYQDIFVSTSTHIRKLSRALETRPERAALVRSLSVRDHGHIDAAIPILNEILLKLKNLTHLLLELSASYQNAALFHTVLVALNKCTFALESFEPRCVNEDVELLYFLIRQPGITSLDAHVAWDAPPPVALPQGSLPRLKYLDTDYDFFLRIIRTPRQITHLSISELPEMEGGLRAVLNVLGHQLVSLKYKGTLRGNDGGPVTPPTIAFKAAALPRLRFLEVSDSMDGGVRTTPVAR